MAAVLAAQAALPSKSATPLVNSRQVLSTRLNKLGGSTLAKALSKDESTASRILSGERGCTIEEFCQLLDLVGLKVVGVEKHCVPADELRMLRRVYSNIIARDLVWEDAE